VNTLIDSSVHAIAYFEPLKINKGLVMCEKLNVKNAIIIGENELKNKTVTIKNLDTREQNTVSLNMLINFLTK
jgi:histidyl-tRNA synthetase